MLIFLFLAALGVFMVLTLLRWFEQITEAVDAGWWNKTLLLLTMPFAVWFFPSKVGAGRAVAVPHFEPVRGMGSLGRAKTTPVGKASGDIEDVPVARVWAPAPLASDQPPPGTPAEFLVKPVVPPTKRGKTPSVDPEKLAQLRKKMRDQGMLDEE